MTGVLVVAGSDSSGAAGLQADLRTLLACGVHAMTAVTCVTAQTSLGIVGSWPVPADAVGAQITSVVGHGGVDAVKTGMLGSADTVRVVVDLLGGRGFPLVVDPVMTASSGSPLITEGGLDLLRAELLPLATVVTPNLAEVERLTGIVVREEEDLRAAATALLALGPRWVLITGGHLPGEAVDLLSDGSTELFLRGPRLDNPFSRGTGCTFASAVAAHLARGADMPTAARRAKGYVSGAIAGAFAVGEGTGVLDHGWTLR